MRKWEKLMIPLLGVVLVVFVAVPLAYGVSPADSDVLYSTYLDWLQGKPVGLASVSVQIDRSLEDMVVVVVDYSEGEPKILYVGTSTAPLVKVARIPVGTYTEREVVDGEAKEVLKTRFRENKLLVIVSAKGYWGARFVEFSPEKPLSKLEVRVPLKEEGSGVTSYSGGRVSASVVSLGTKIVDNIKLFKLHSVPGVTQKVIIDENDKMAIDSFSQAGNAWSEEVDPNGWERSGSVNVPFGYAPDNLGASNGEMKVVYGRVRYRLDRYYVCGYLLCRPIYELVPEEIVGFSKIETLSDPGKIPSGLIKEAHLKTAGESFRVFFHDLSDDGGVYLSTPSLSFCIGEGVNVCFTGSVDSYRKSEGAASRIAFQIIINNWRGSRLYYAKYSSRGNYYEVPLEWGS
ncbi:MAG: hypothetical protein PWQ79_1165 [Thermococcaceae archaeon]|nr:hypothetical protein [Thermococcaceae archaeon]